MRPPRTVRRRAFLGRQATGFLLAAVVLLGLLLALPASALAWANGPNYGNGFGTHDWILSQAERLAASKGAGWVRLSVALPHTDDPDTVFHDFYYHVYERWNGHNYGNAPLKVDAWYAKALTARKQGNWRAASIDIALLSHYLSDICQPMHTDQMSLEEKVHAAYESKVDDITSSARSVTWWVTFDGYQAPTDVQRLAIGAATASHRDYYALVTDYAAGGWSNPTVQSITRRSLNRAVNDLADLIIAIYKKVPAQ